MKTSVTKFVFSTAVGALLLVATTASAERFKFGGASGGNKSGGNDGNSSQSSGNGNSNSAFRIKFRGLGTSNNNSNYGNSNSSADNSGSSNSDKKKKNNNGFGIPFGTGNIPGLSTNQLSKFDEFNKFGKLKKYDDCDYDKHGHGYDCHHHHVRIYCVQPIDNCYYPYFSSCSVYPGDTYNTLSLRAYGMSTFGRQIASYNRLGSSNTKLIPGHALQFPVIHPDGRLTKSNAPAHVPFTTPSNYLSANNTQLGANNTQFAKATAPTAATGPKNDASIPSIAVGSVLLLEGQAFGSEKGTAKLRFGGLSLPVEIVEWTPNAAKVQLPKLDVTTPTTVDLELTLANGTLASKSTIKLTPVTTQVAKK